MLASAGQRGIAVKVLHNLKLIRLAGLIKTFTVCPQLVLASAGQRVIEGKILHNLKLMRLNTFLIRPHLMLTSARQGGI